MTDETAEEPYRAYRDQVAGMGAAEARDYLLNYLDYLFDSRDRLADQYCLRFGVSETQGKLLAVLTRVPNRTVPRNEIMGFLYGDREFDHWPSASILDTLVSQLRRALEKHPSCGLSIETVPRIGYVARLSVT